MVTLHRLSLLGAVVVVVAALSGCGGGNGGSADEGGSTSGSGSSSGSVIKTVTIDESEYKLRPSSVTLDEVGTYEFKAVNKGSVTHALEVEGNGVEEESEEIAPGKSATFRITFKGAGSYEMYCPVDGHEDKGMVGKITIGSAAAGSGGTTTNQTTPGETTETDDKSGVGSNSPDY